MLYSSIQTVPLRKVSSTLIFITPPPPSDNAAKFEGDAPRVPPLHHPGNRNSISPWYPIIIVEKTSLEIDLALNHIDTSLH